jgi:CDP-paratose 2-epimerase
VKDGYTLITGGAGFIGSNVVDALLADGERVVIADSFARDGASGNAQWLQARHGSRVTVTETDVRNAKAMRPLVAGASAVFHLAAQVAVTTSIEDPVLDLETNLLGTFNILEAARAMRSPPPILFTSTNKVYGELDGFPVDRNGGPYHYAGGRSGVSEAAPLDFHSPYGCSKGAADQYVRDYARIFGLDTVVFRMSCIYGTRQLGTEDQGWVAHFARSLLAGEPLTIYGDGHQVRDILWVDDLVAAMRAAMRKIRTTSGAVFNVGGGPANAVSVRQVIEALMLEAGEHVPVSYAPWRPGDQRVYVSDTAKLEAALGWRAKTHWRDGLGKLVRWLREPERPAPPAAVLRRPERSAARPVVAGAAG